MPVALGRTISQPFFVFFQITNAVSMFLLVLGTVRILIIVVVGVQISSQWPDLTDPTSSTTVAPHETTPSVTSMSAPSLSRTEVPAVTGVLRSAKPGARTTTTAAPHDVACFHVSLSSLFDGPVQVDIPGPPSPIHFTDSSRAQFFWLHVLTALLTAYPLSVLLQRRKLVLDFVLTVYAVYFVLADVFLRRALGGGVHWWLTVLCGLAVSYGATWFTCRRRELQAISLGSGASASAHRSPVASVTTALMASTETEMVEIGPTATSPTEERGAVLRSSPAPATRSTVPPVPASPTPQGPPHALYDMSSRGGGTAGVGGQSAAAAAAAAGAIAASSPATNHALENTMDDVHPLGAISFSLIAPGSASKLKKK